MLVLVSIITYTVLTHCLTVSINQYSQRVVQSVDSDVDWTTRLKSAAILLHQGPDDRHVLCSFSCNRVPAVLGRAVLPWRGMGPVSSCCPDWWSVLSIAVAAGAVVEVVVALGP